ncbi:MULTISPECIES: hypothetical protein [unclassified Paenibacillus]|uniref:hypothetical protein n=1 Tax=unclassified Paenibacillus TaxID=185978 RepID=UPI00363F757F
MAKYIKGSTNKAYKNLLLFSFLFTSDHLSALSTAPEANDSSMNAAMLSTS